MNRKLENFLVYIFQWPVVCIVLIALALLGARACVIEDKARRVKLEQHIEELTLREVPDVTAPKPPVGLRLNPNDLAVPKTTVFQDASHKRERSK